MPALVPTQRIVKVFVVAFGLLAVLAIAGVNVTAAVAGLGVGGLAVALAAQKTIENLFGGATLFADQPVRVGDFCRFGGQVGTIEEIGLRSTRVRTLDRTVVSIPNAEFSNLHLENFAKRDRMRIYTMIGVLYETTPEQLRYLLARLRELLLEHPRITDDPARVRFVGFGAYSLDLELFAYADTADWNELLQIREDLYLRIMDVVNESGTGFAFPSSTMYVGHHEGPDAEASRAAAERVQGVATEKACCRSRTSRTSSSGRSRIRSTGRRAAPRARRATAVGYSVSAAAAGFSSRTGCSSRNGGGSMFHWGRIALAGLAPLLAVQVAAAEATPGYNHA